MFFSLVKKIEFKGTNFTKINRFIGIKLRLVCRLFFYFFKRKMKLFSIENWGNTRHLL